MSQPLIANIEKAIERGNIPADTPRNALRGDDMDLRGLGYMVLTEPHLRAYINGYKPRKSDVKDCFAYLLDCVAENLDWDHDYAHSREEALEELASILDPYWAAQGVGLKPVEFWQQIGTMIKTELAEENPEFLSPLLSAFKDDTDFETAMADWTKDPVLARFMENLRS